MAVTPEQARAVLAARRQEQKKSTGGDFDVRSVAQQLAQGMLLSFSDELIGIMGGVRGALSGDDFGEQYRTARDIEREQQQSFSDTNPGAALASNILGGLLTGGVGFGAMKAAGAGTKAAAALTPALEGAVSAVGASNREGLESLSAAPLGAATGAAAGVVGNAVTRGFGGRTFGDVAQASADDLGRTPLDRASRLGIKLSLGEELADNARKQGASMLDSQMVTKGIMAGRATRNQKAINRAVLNRFGFDGEKVTGRMLEKIESKANGLYDDFAKIVGNGRFQRTPEFRGAMADAVQAFKAADKDPALARAIQKTARIVNKGGAPGKAIKRRLNEVRDLARRARRANKQDLADGYDALQDALFNALDPGTSSAAKDALAKASRYWRDMKIVDTENVLEAVSGNIKPSALSSMLGRSRFTRDAFTRNVEPDNQIFEIGRLMRQVGEDPDSIVGKFRSSRTSERNMLNQLLGIAASPVTVPAALGQVTETGQRIATEAGRRGTTSAARAAGAATQSP